MIKGIVQDLRNAYDVKDRVAHEDALRRLDNWHNKGCDECTLGTACVCNKHTKTVCMHRQPEKK